MTAPPVEPRPLPDDDSTATPWVALALLTLVALVLRATGLNGGLWYDEIRTVLDSVRSPWTTIVTVFPSNNQHTLYSLLAHATVGVLGEAAWTVRLPAMLLGTACVPMLYACAREFTGRREALLAALLLAVDYHHVWFSQNARGYSGLAFLTLLATWLLLRGLRRQRAGDFVAYAAAAALGVYMHLTMVFLVAAHALVCAIPLAGTPVNHAARGWWKLPLLGFSLAGGLTLLLYLPILLQVQQFFVDRPSPMMVATPRWAFLELLRGLNIGVGMGLWALARIALLTIGGFSYLRQSRFLTGLFVMPGIVTAVAAVAMHRPIFPRFLFFLIGFGILGLVRGALVTGRWLGRRRTDPGAVTPAGMAIVAGMVLVSLVTLVPNYRYPKQDFAGALDFLDAHRNAGDPVATVGVTRHVYRTYYGRPWLVLASGADLEAALAAGRRVWVVYTLAGYIRVAQPEIMQALVDRCAVDAVFPGTLNDGEVTVCHVDPANR